MTTPFKCPDCGSSLDLDDKAETETQVWRVNHGGMPFVENILRPAIVAFCTGCEFAIEVGR